MLFIALFNEYPYSDLETAGSGSQYIEVLISFESFILTKIDTADINKEP